MTGISIQFSRYALVWLGVLLCACALHGGVKTGQMAPDFLLPTYDGKVSQLADLRGRWVVLEWFDPRCPYVQKFYSQGHMPLWQNQLKAQGVIWLSIYSTGPGQEGFVGPAECQALATGMNMASTALLNDAKGTVARQYGATVAPQVFLINPEGVLVYQGAVDNSPGTSPDDISSARNYLMNALGAVRRGRPVMPSTVKPYGCELHLAPETEDKPPPPPPPATQPTVVE